MINFCSSKGPYNRLFIFYSLFSGINFLYKKTNKIGELFLWLGYNLYMARMGSLLKGQLDGFPTTQNGEETW